MPDNPSPYGMATKEDEDRLAHALISRGLVTKEEAQECAAGNERGIEAFLKRLVKAGFLTRNQARRVAKELPLLSGEQIPGYELLEKIGQGAMGAVYKARQTSMNRLVAVKTLHPRLARDPEYIKRFM